MTYLPATPGLLISMCIRYDHAFGLDPTFMMIPGDTMTLEDKQIKTVRMMKLFYDTVVSHKTVVAVYDRGTHKQLCEEMTGEGFYRSSKEDDYVSFATLGAKLEAIQLCTDKVSYSKDGPPLGDFKLEDIKPQTKGLEYDRTLFFD